MGIWKWGFEATVGDGLWGSDPFGPETLGRRGLDRRRVRFAGRWEWEIPPGGVAHRECRRGPMAPILQSLRSLLVAT